MWQQPNSAKLQKLVFQQKNPWVLGSLLEVSWVEDLHCSPTRLFVTFLGTGTNGPIWMFLKIVGFPPKSSTLIGFSMIFTIHFGVPLFLETPISSESIMEWNGRNVLTWCPSARFLDLQFRHKSSKANRQTLPVDSARPCQSSQCLPCTFPPNKTFNFLKCSHHLQLP